jgi:transposase
MKKLLRVARSSSHAFRHVVRARIVLFSQLGYHHDVISRMGYGCERTVAKWINRFSKSKPIASLLDRHRPGRPRCYQGAFRQQIIALACQAPDELGLKGLSHWSLRDIAGFIPRFLKAQSRVSHETVRQILKSSLLKPHRIRYYLCRTDPQFVEKATKILNLYDKHRQDPEAFHLVCFDELTGIQALQRKHPTLPMMPGRIERQEFEYIRHGTRCLMSAFMVASGKVFARVYINRKRPRFMLFLDGLVDSLRDKKQIHIILDNLNTHRGEEIDDWLQSKRGRVLFHYTPFHGSWLNQVEIWFSILKRKCLKRGSFTSTDDLKHNMLRFIGLWNRYYAHPFNWTYTEEKFLRSIEEKEHLPLAA